MTFDVAIAQNPLDQLEKEKQLLPEPVFDLFYAVKNSLDYGHIDGYSTETSPKTELTDYSRVSQKLLKEVTKSYEILSYEIKGDDYILLLKSKTDEVQYKATRHEKFKLTDKGWVSLGKYIYF